MLKTDLLGEPVWLLPDKGLYLPERRTLLVADTHFGKAATFRRAGIPVPTGGTAGDLKRLSRMIDDTQAERLVVLGDFFHAAAGRAAATMDTIEGWIGERRQLAIVIVRGNHDHRAGDPPAHWNCLCSDELSEPPFLFRHHPDSTGEAYTVCGHLHPSVYIAERGGPGLTAPCFWFTKHLAVLPAFGRFTGKAVIEREPGDRVFAVSSESVHEVPAPRRLRGKARA